MIRIRGSHGTLVVDRQGVILTRMPKGAYGELQALDIARFINTTGIDLSDPTKDHDILCFGTWDKNGGYDTPAHEHLLSIVISRGIAKRSVLTRLVRDCWPALADKDLKCAVSIAANSAKRGVDGIDAIEEICAFLNRI